MSLESKVQELTETVSRLTDALNAHQTTIVAPIPKPVQVARAPVVSAPAPVGAPFIDNKGLIDYVMGAYTAMGPQKGAAIQNVLTQLGYQNINDVKPEHFNALYQGVEALKAA